MFAKIFRSISPLALATAALTLAAPNPLLAQATSSLVTTRLTQPIDENARVTLKGTVSPLARAANDRGAAPDSMSLDRLQLVLKRSDAQESALKQLVSDLHSPGSASYHKWLTPDQFGKQFGPSDQDVATVESWLQSHGFSVTKLNAGKQSLEISGNVAQFRSTFHAQIHKYQVNGETHYANAADPQIPAALAPVIGGFASLNNFRIKSHAKVLGKATYDPKTDKATPEWTTSNTPIPNFVLSPGDYAVQYDLNPLYTAGTNGAGQTIAVINDSNINVAVVNQFRTLFSLPANPPQVIINGNDPGIDGINNPDGPSFDSVEAYLDVEWSGAVAPNATIDLVIAADTALQNGLTLALQHAIYGNIAPVISLSFGACELNLGAGNQFIASLYEQAAAQGITVLASTGDAGSAGCDNDNSQFFAVNGQAVSGFASTPYNVAVGGTDFFYTDYATGGASTSTFWNTTTSNNTPLVSIKGVIPEQPWNNSQFGLNIFDLLTESGGTETTIGGAGGGASNCATGTGTSASGGWVTCTAGYPKPTWQKGTGVPADSVRDIPDVSLFAANGANSSYYPICAIDGDCQPVSSSGTVQIYGVGGTSASTPSFAGIMALVNQKYGRQGQANFVLYPLATQFPAAFHDVTKGSNSVPCAISTPNCIAVTNPVTITDPNLGTSVVGQIGSGTTPEYNATVGYDLASGLGTVDANTLVTDWGKVTFTSSATTLTPSSTSFAHGASITVSGSVTPTSGTATGSVALLTDSTEPLTQGQGVFPLTSGSFSNSSVNFLPGGTYNIWGQYSGDGTNGASTSAKTSITVTPEASGIVFNLFSPVGTTAAGSIVSGASIDYGTQLLLSALVAPSSQLTALQNCLGTSAACPSFGVPTGTVVFADGTTTLNTAVINAQGDAEYNAPFAIGSHSVTASYPGDNSYSKSTASAVTFTVVKDTPIIALSASNQVSQTQFANGQPTVFNIQVANGTMINAGNTFNAAFPSPVAPPTGTITMTGLPSGVPTTATLVAGVVPGYQAQQGVATITAPASTAAGNYTVNISYPGDANYGPATYSQVVQIGSLGGMATTTTATMTGTISPTTSITITGTVTGQSGQPAPSNNNGTGGVGIFSSGSFITAIPVVPGTGDVSTFSITLNSQTLFQGANFITLQYLGDQIYNISSFTLNSGNAISNPLSDFSMIPETTIVSVPSSGPATDVINLSSVNGFSGNVALTCTGTGGVGCSLSNASPALTSGGSAAVTLTVDNNNVLTAGTAFNLLVTGVDPTGEFKHTLGIRVVAPATTLPPGLTLTGPSSITIINPGDTGTGTLNVTPSGGLTGAATFSCSVEGSPAGMTCSAPGASIVLGTAAASTLSVVTTASTPAASYTADVTVTAGGVTSAILKVPITLNPAANFALSGSPASLTLAAGATTGNTSTISVTPSSGFTGTVNLTCALTTSPSGATKVPTCTIGSSVNITGTSAATATLTVATTAPTTSALDLPLNKFFAVGGGIAVAGLLFFGIPARRRSWRTILGVLLFAAIVGMGIGCGSGGGNSGGGGGGGTTTPGTTAGAYVITVTGTDASTGKLVQSATVNVTVQ